MLFRSLEYPRDPLPTPSLRTTYPDPPLIAGPASKRQQRKEEIDELGRTMSKITGQPKRVLAKRAFPPKDAARRVYECGLEGCSKSCESSVFFRVGVGWS